MLADGQTKNISRTGQGEAVDGDVVGDLGDLLEDKFLELSRVQDLARLCNGRDTRTISFLNFWVLENNRGREQLRGERGATYCFHQRRKRHC